MQEMKKTVKQETGLYGDCDGDYRNVNSKGPIAALFTKGREPTLLVDF